MGGGRRSVRLAKANDGNSRCEMGGVRGIEWERITLDNKEHQEKDTLEKYFLNACWRHPNNRSVV